jgi:ligand-binding SRPBCC domain-containing protein
LTFEFWVDAPIEEVWDFHSSAKALELLTPQGRRLEPLVESLDVVDGALHVFRFRERGFAGVWKARISNVRPPHRFVDTAEQSPFAYWEHVHEFVALEGRTLVRDTVTYKPPLGVLGWLADQLFIRRDIERLFAFRKEATQAALQRRT